MSDSRLEKFIYAICSMDVSDLPVPLSRIETLWNCLITGETPDFEPLSRNEKYLMAMLDRYDISNLPAPMSRGEKLLYKIAVGETDLSDVPGYLSRYEELLKYLIENGGISGGDFEYVLHTINQSLYTLYATAEKPVKSAILSGNTLVNLSEINKFSISGRGIKISTSLKMMKNNTFYTRIVYITKNTLIGVNERNNVAQTIGLSDDNGLFSTDRQIALNETGLICKECLNSGDLSSKSSASHIRVFTVNTGGVLEGYEIIVEGDYTNQDIPYFDGMQSVKMPVLTTTGKNICDMVGLANTLNKIDNKIVVIDESTWEMTSTPSYHNVNFKYRPIKFKENTSYTISFEGQTTDDSRTTLANIIKVIYIDGTESNMRSIGFNKVTTPSNKTIDHVRFSYGVTGVKESISNLSIVEGESTSYEPYKSNILSTPRDLELRGIVDVKDELNLLTGELTQRIGEIVLDGSGNWKTDINGAGVKRYFLEGVGSDLSDNISNSSSLLCDKFKASSNIWIETNDGAQIVKSNGIYFIDSSVDSLDAFVNKLKTTNIKVQYSLIEKPVKTVDLTIVDQDNQPTQLGTFENVTHVSLEAENLIPEVEMEVATNLLEDTVFNLTNAFNTLYPTAEKPVKSAILKGQTLVNVLTGGQQDNTTDKDFIDYFIGQNLKANTVYTAIFQVETEAVELRVGITKSQATWNSNTMVYENGYNKVLLTTTVETAYSLRIRHNDGGSKAITVSNVMLIEGDHTNVDIPYFEGIQSVKMPVLTTTGKNLFDGNLIGGYFNNNISSIAGDDGKYKSIKIKLNKGTYTLSFERPVYIIREIIDGVYNQNVKTATTYTFTLNTDGYYGISFRDAVSGTIWSQTQVMIEQGTVATSYEPYKSNILTTSEEVELRGVSDVKDELNLLTSELTQRFTEIVLDGSENWRDSNAGQETVNTIRFITNIKDSAKSSLNIITDNFPISNVTSYDIDLETIQTTGGALYIRILKSKLSSLDVDGLKAWLSRNPITVQYPLAIESIKTVDLTVVNQDGNETKLRTFDDTTHVLLNSEGLVPTASLTVRTKIPSASSTSLLMDDISKEQQQLSEIIDEQTNNVDVAMVATTEIYEETL